LVAFAVQRGEVNALVDSWSNFEATLGTAFLATGWARPMM